MATAPTRNILGVITDFLASDPTPQEILEYQLPDDLQARAHDLLERNGEGELSFEEEQEMYDFMRVDQMLSLLKAKTQLRLRKQSEK